MAAWGGRGTKVPFCGFTNKPCIAVHLLWPMLSWTSRNNNGGWTCSSLLLIKELSTAELYPLNILSKSRLSSKASSRLELIASQLTIVNANLDAPQIFVADQNDHRLTIIRNKHLCLGTSVCGISRLAFTNVATGLKILVFTRPNKSVYKETAASHLQGEIFQKSLVFPVEGPLLWHSLALEGNAMCGGVGSVNGHFTYNAKLF